MISFSSRIFSLITPISHFAFPITPYFKSHIPWFLNTTRITSTKIKYAMPTSKGPVNCKAAGQRSAAADMAARAAVVCTDARMVVARLSAAHTAAHMAFARTAAEVVAVHRVAGYLA